MEDHGAVHTIPLKVPCPEDKPRELCHGNNPHGDVMQGEGREKAQPGNREGYLQWPSQKAKAVMH